MGQYNIKCIGDKCYGCSSCIYSCPTEAISFEYNQEGFLYPVINENLCVKCKKCLLNCPVNNKIDNEINYEKKYFGFIGKECIDLSASGGFAFFASNVFVKKNEYVCGCVYDENFKVVHKLTNNFNDILKMCSSKYVQSNLGNVYYEIKEKLIQKNEVLFIGTPCQVHGLLSFLEKKYDNLLTIDLICHGVPSPLLFEKYLDYIKQKEKTEIIEYNFRDKTQGWDSLIRSYKLANNKKRICSLSADKYGIDFLNGQNYRESCYQCKYSNIESRPGDITIGDFWGIEKVKIKLDYIKGVSSIVANSKKGEDFIKNNLQDNYLFVCAKEDILRDQGNLVHPTIRKSERDYFYDNFKSNYYFNKSINLKTKILNLIPLNIKKFIKKHFVK